MRFSYSRTIRFADTDGAGVVYFAQILSICHEAYEASLEVAGINLREFFRDPAIAVPLVHAEADFRQPVFCGDRLTVTLQPWQLSSNSYEIKYEIHKQETPQDTSQKQREPYSLSQPKLLTEIPEIPELPELQLVAQAQTKHICINPQLRTRQELPAHLHQWLIQTRGT